MPDISFGQPQFSEYEPALKIPSTKGLNSTVSRINGSKTNRVHHLLSSHETRYFYYLEWAGNVTDIRELLISVKSDRWIGVFRTA